MSLLKVARGRDKPSDLTTLDGNTVYFFSTDNTIYLGENCYSSLSGAPLATDSDLGVVKLNNNDGISVNSNNQLKIDGRLGQFTGTTGIFHSNDREPRNVSDFSLLITDAKGMNLNAPRSFALSTGVNLTLTKSHEAGSIAYTVTNNYVNRIACAVLANGGYVSLSEAKAKEEAIVAVTSVTINNSTFTPSSISSATGPIVITTEKSANPNSSTNQLRIFGGITGGYCSEYIGQCVGGTAGASLIIGQRVFSSANVNCIVAADTYNTGNGNAIFGRQHINTKNRWLIAGTGHDTTSGRNESGMAVGQWSDISSDTLFAIGNGTSATDRSNAFEVREEGIVLDAPNGTQWIVEVDNYGVLKTVPI